MIAYLQVPWPFDTRGSVSCHGLLSAPRPPLAGCVDRRGDQAAARPEHRAAPGGDAHGRRSGGGGAGQPQAPDYAVRGGQHQRRQELFPAAHPQGKRGAARHCRGAHLLACAGDTSPPSAGSRPEPCRHAFESTGLGVESGDAGMAHAVRCKLPQLMLSCSLSREWWSRCLTQLCVPRWSSSCQHALAVWKAGRGVRHQACQRHTHCQLPYSGDTEGVAPDCQEA